MAEQVAESLSLQPPEELQEWRPKIILEPPLREPALPTVATEVDWEALADPHEPADLTPIDISEPPPTLVKPVVPNSSKTPSDPFAKGLAWLQRQQAADGSFRPGEGRPDLTPAVTSMAMMAFLADGAIGVGIDARNRAVQRAADYLLQSQQTDGGYGRVNDPAADCFNHSVATLGLLERYLLLRAAADTDPQLLSQHERSLVLALDRVERWLALLFEGDQPGMRVCEGENAAWCTLVLALAQRSELDWNLNVMTEQRVAAMLARLRQDAAAAQHEPVVSTVVSPMLETLTEQEWDDWQRVIVPMMEDPALAGPGLRFVVAMAVALSDRSGWQPEASDDFFERARAVVVATQQAEFGYFEPPYRSCFDGGGIGDSATSLMTLRVEPFARKLLGSLPR